MHRTVERMLRTNPEPPFAPADVLATAIHACVECAQACTACADACLGEHAPAQLERCIRLDQDCADLCNAAARVLSRQQSPEVALILQLIELVAQICEACAAECERHAHRHPHCHVCATACHRCAAACQELTSRADLQRQLHH